MNQSIINHSGIIRSAGCDIFYEVTGSGPAIIFAHGLGGNYLSWWQQIPFFSQKFTCITFSHRGFWPSKEIPESYGTSDFADDLTALIDHLQLQEVILVAQSMGGWTSLEYALRNQERVRALVMSSTTGAVNFNAIVHPDIEKIIRWETDSVNIKKELESDGILAATGKRMAVEQPALYYLYCHVNNLTPLSFRENVRTKVRSERILPSAKLLELKIPILFITANEDMVFPPDAANAVAAHIPNAQHQQIVNAGHSAYFEHADIYNQIVDSFLKKH